MNKLISVASAMFGTVMLVCILYAVALVAAWGNTDAALWGTVAVVAVQLSVVPWELWKSRTMVKAGVKGVAVFPLSFLVEEVIRYGFFEHLGFEALFAFTAALVVYEAVRTVGIVMTMGIFDKKMQRIVAVLRTATSFMHIFNTGLIAGFGLWGLIVAIAIHYLWNTEVVKRGPLFTAARMYGREWAELHGFAQV
jgi:hypothetical protein